MKLKSKKARKAFWALAFLLIAYLVLLTLTNRRPAIINSSRMVPVVDERGSNKTLGAK